MRALEAKRPGSSERLAGAVQLMLVLALAAGAASVSPRVSAAQASTRQKDAGTKHPASRSHHTLSGSRTGSGAGDADAKSTPSSDSPAAPAPADAIAATRNAQLRTAPGGIAIALVSPAATLEPVAHDHGWVRVRVEGWLPDSAAGPAPGGGNLSAADLRADPDAARGRTVRWDVEVLAMANADPLRKGLSPDEPYLLVRGPGRETALAYLAIPPRLLTAARAIASEAPVAATMVATVRVGRSEPAGVPILDAQVLARR